MRHARAVMLETDTIDHVEWFCSQLSYKYGREVSFSEGLEYIVARHWMKTKKRIAGQKANRKIERNRLDQDSRRT